MPYSSCGSVDASRKLGIRLTLARALAEVGALTGNDGGITRARGFLTESLDLYSQLQSPHAETVRERLRHPGAGDQS